MVLTGNQMQLHDNDSMEEVREKEVY